MKKIISLFEKITEQIKELNSTFLVRYDPNNTSKLNFTNMLFASLVTLNCSGIESVSSRLEEEKIVTVTKTALINKRNDSKTFKYIRKLNEHLINIFYDPENFFINRYNFNIDTKHTVFSNKNYA